MHAFLDPMAKKTSSTPAPAKSTTVPPRQSRLFLRKLTLTGFRGIKSGEVLLEPRTALIGANACGKSSIIDAISLLLGRTKIVRGLTEHDFYGSDPGPTDRFRVVGTVCGFSNADPARNTEWFRARRAIPKWIDKMGRIHAKATPDTDLCAEIALVGRFDAEELEVETTRHFCDGTAATIDPFDDTFPAELVPGHLLHDLGLFVLPARRGGEGIVSFASELFRRTISNAGGLPASEILTLRNQLRSPLLPIEASPQLAAIVASINQRLEGLLSEKPKLRLLLTATDAESVLTALVPHYAMGGRVLPASRHGSGLMSLQTLLLLLEIGRLREEQGLNFILALEEPELHLAPGIQTRLVAAANRVGAQTISTTHASRVASAYAPTQVQVLSLSKGVLTSVPLLSAPLPPSATNSTRKLFYQNKTKLIDALMHPFVLVPEGSLDVEWLTRLASAGEPYQEQPAFTSVFGLAPTENGEVAYTVKEVRARRPNVVALTDGDAPGRRYEAEVRAQTADAICVGWHDNWTIEDVVGWVLSADATVLPRIETSITSLSFATVGDLVVFLKQKNEAGTRGLKDDRVAHDAIVGELSEPCLKRVGTVLDALVCSVLGPAHANLHAAPSDPSAFRFNP
jgi:hypothetical protein